MKNRYGGWSLIALVASVAFGQTDILASRYDAARTGQNLTETTLNAQNVNAGSFGKLYAYAIDGQAYAQPLVKGQLAIPGSGTFNVVFIATEHGSVYALDADSATPIWYRSFINPATGLTTRTTNPSLEDIVPEVSITSTPVIDPASGTLYVVAETVQSGNPPFYWLHALDLVSGQDKVAPVKVQASLGTGQSPLTLDAATSQQRPGLVFSNGVVYVGFGSSGDNYPWVGWLLAYDGTTLSQVGVFCSSPGGAQGAGLWSSGEAPPVDASGNIYVSTGNGYFSANSGWGDAFVKLAPGNLAVLDYFAPFNQMALGAADLDLASAGLTVLPDEAGSAQHPHLLIGSGKDGEVYLLDRDNMGQYDGSYSTPNSQIVQWLPGQVGTGVLNPANPSLPYVANSYTTPAYWQNRIYFCGVQDSCKLFSLGNAQLSTTPLSSSANVFGYPGAQPVISAASATDTSAILWALERDSTHNLTVLHAYDATNLATEFYNSAQAAGGRDAGGAPVRFAVPAVANGKVFVNTAVELDVYGLLAGALPTLASPTFTPAAGSYAGPQTVTLGAPAGAIVYYTLDGSVPTRYSNVYSTPLLISATTTVRAMAVQSGFYTGPAASATYTIAAPPVPTAPGTLSATAAGPTRIALSWGPASEPGGMISQYLIERCQGSGCSAFALIASVGASTTAYTDAGLAAATAYTYRVRAEDSLNTPGPYSNAATTSTSAATPSAPGTLTGSPAGSTSISLSWGAASEQGGTLTDYLVERCMGAGCTAFTQIAMVNVPITSYADGGLAGSTPYSYRVRVRDRGGATGPYSNVASTSTAAGAPGAPAGLKASATGASTIALSWSAASEAGGTVGQYLIERCSGAACTAFAQIASVGASVTSFTDTGLSGSTNYSYRVRARDTAGANGPYSSVASATTAALPAGPAASPGGGGALGLELMGLAALWACRRRRRRAPAA